MRVFKEVQFSRKAWKHGITDTELWSAARAVAVGNFDADLGSGLFKQRIARRGGGKSGGFRTIIGFRRPNIERIFFVYVFAKNEGSNLTPDGHKALAIVARAFLSATDKKIRELVKNGDLLEIIAAADERSYSP